MPQRTTDTRKAWKEPPGMAMMAADTIAVRPAAGPDTLSCDLLRAPMTIPPTIPAIRPLKRGAFEARATPRQSGSATRNTTIDEGISAPRDARGFFLVDIEIAS